MNADIDTQIQKFTALRGRVVTAAAAFQAALARALDIGTELTALRASMLAEDTAPLDASTRMAVVDVVRERRNRQEAAAATMAARYEEIVGMLGEVVDQLAGIQA